jgi:hypothetical protein
MSWKLTFLAAVLAFAAADQFCRGLALGGGNDLGAYQAGAISGLLSNLPAHETDYNIIAGLGFGSLNALIVSQFNNSQNTQLERTLSDFWKNSRRHDFLKDWPFGKIEGYHKHSGMYDSSPMRQTIRKLMNLSSGFARPFTAGATDLISGHLKIFNQTNSRGTLETGILASASGYIEMPVTKFQDMVLIEGSLAYTADILGVLNYCIDQGYEESNIIVDIIFTQSSKLNVVNAEKYRTLDVVRRVAQIYGYDSANLALEVAFNTHPEANYRYIIQPSSRLPGKDESSQYDFSKKELNTLYEAGMSDAGASIRQDPFS